MLVVKTGCDTKTKVKVKDLSYLRAHPPPPSAGFNVTFEDLTLDTAAGAPLIFARLTAV